MLPLLLPAAAGAAAATATATATATAITATATAVAAAAAAGELLRVPRVFVHDAGFTVRATRKDTNRAGASARFRSAMLSRQESLSSTSGPRPSFVADVHI